MASKVEIINASNADLHVICDILAEAFCPYRKDYTEEAYRVTISSPQEISARIDSDLTGAGFLSR